MTSDIDTVTFDHINRKFIYKIPLDSFQMIQLKLINLNYSGITIYCAISTLENDSIIEIDSSDFKKNYFSYWNSKAETIMVSVGIKYKHETFGIFKNNSPKLFFRCYKTNFPPVKKDSFHDDTSSMIFLNKDTLYNLSVYHEHDDKFFYSIEKDSTYLFTIKSTDSTPVNIQLYPFDLNISFKNIIDTRKIIFKANILKTLCAEIRCHGILPANYSLILEPYTGDKSKDTHEPNDDISNASLLIPDSCYSHTAFPTNDIDLFKINCLGNDTFKIYIDFKDSTILKNHYNFRFVPLHTLAQNELNIHKLSNLDSASYKIIKFYWKVADTAIFKLKDSEYLDYSIELRK